MFERFRRRDESASGTADHTPDALAADATGRRAEERSVGDREATAVAERDAGERRFERKERTREVPPATAAAAAPAAPPAGRPADERDRDVERHPVRDRDHDGVADRAEHRHATRGPLVAGETMAAVRERQRERFGGVSWGGALFGFLAALGLAAILTAILAAAGVALGLVDQATGSDASTSDAETIGLGGAIALLLVLAIAWYCGGYAAGRMSRFDGGRQGLGVWAWTIVAAVVVAALAAIGGSKYDVFQSLNLPSLPVNGSTLTGAGAIAGAAAIVVTLVAAVVGGKVGERFHRRVDRVAHADAGA